MAIMNLSVSANPFSAGGIAGVNLMVSVSDADGKPYIGLTKPNFHLHWISNVTLSWGIESLLVLEYTAANELPEMPGVYQVEAASKDYAWAPSAPVTFFLAVNATFVSPRGWHRSDHGQILYTVGDPLAALGMP